MKTNRKWWLGNYTASRPIAYTSEEEAIKQVEIWEKGAQIVLVREVLSENTAEVKNNTIRFDNSIPGLINLDLKRIWLCTRCGHKAEKPEIHTDFDDNNPGKCSGYFTTWME